MRKIVIASNNAGKIKEIQNILGNNKFEFLSLKEIVFYQDILEDQDSFEGNAYKKAESVARVVNDIVLADDSGLEVDILNGQPGVFSARFSGKNATDENNNEKLLKMMKDVPEEKRGAQFRCVIVIILPNGKSFKAEGICRGKITDKPNGNKGFGYDPIFIPVGYNKTFGQMEKDEKNRISHRFLALQRLKEIMMGEGLLD